MPFCICLIVLCIYCVFFTKLICGNLAFSVSLLVALFEQSQYIVSIFSNQVFLIKLCTFLKTQCYCAIKRLQYSVTGVLLFTENQKIHTTSHIVILAPLWWSHLSSQHLQWVAVYFSHPGRGCICILFFFVLLCRSFFIRYSLDCLFLLLWLLCWYPESANIKSCSFFFSDCLLGVLGIQLLHLIFNPFLVHFYEWCKCSPVLFYM